MLWRGGSNWNAFAQSYDGEPLRESVSKKMSRKWGHLGPMLAMLCTWSNFISLLQKDNTKNSLLVLGNGHQKVVICSMPMKYTA